MLLGKLGERPGTKRKQPATQTSLRVKLPWSKYCEWVPQLCPKLPCPRLGRNLGISGQQVPMSLRSSLRQCFRMTRMLWSPQNPKVNSISLHTCLRPSWDLHKMRWGSVCSMRSHHQRTYLDVTPPLPFELRLPLPSLHPKTVNHFSFPLIIPSRTLFACCSKPGRCSRWTCL